MKKVLVTGGTVFVSKFVAEYFAAKEEYEVYVLNRNNHPQPANTKLIMCDKNEMGSLLSQYNFDIVLDITSYTKMDVKVILDSIGSVSKYILLSSSAVYPETLNQPFREDACLGRNKFWRDYGTNKIDAENYLLENKKDAYIIRPPYLYGPLNNVYREAFVFDCAEQNRKFYLPKDGQMKLQFFHVRDLCKLIEAIILKTPEEHIYNVGNEESISVADWVKICYDIVGSKLETVNVHKELEQRLYFSFYDYEYALDVTRQKTLLPETINLVEGLKESYDWYKENKNCVVRKNYFDFIDGELSKDLFVKGDSKHS